MRIIEPFLAEFSHEAGTTRKMLEALPEGELSWAPHPKSMTLGKLASHIAEIPGWVQVTLSATELDLNPNTFKPADFKTRKDVLGHFDGNVANSVSAMKDQADANLFVPWTLKQMGKPVLTMPRIAVLRTWVLNHLIHHRGQLSVYLRLKNVPLPSVYGPTADSPGM